MHFYCMKEEAKKGKDKQKDMIMEITHPQFHRRRGWSLCSWCGGHAVEDKQTEGPTVREIKK